MSKGSHWQANEVVICLLSTETVTTDHENMGIDTLFVTKTLLSVMVSLIKGFLVQSHTPDLAAIHFYDGGGRPNQKIRLKIVALFT